MRYYSCYHYNYNTCEVNYGVLNVVSFGFTIIGNLNKNRTEPVNAKINMLLFNPRLYKQSSRPRYTTLEARIYSGQGSFNRKHSSSVSVSVLKCLRLSSDPVTLKLRRGECAYSPTVSTFFAFISFYCAAAFIPFLRLCSSRDPSLYFSALAALLFIFCFPLVLKYQCF